MIMGHKSIVLPLNYIGLAEQCRCQQTALCYGSFCDSFEARIRKNAFAETPQLKLCKQVRSDLNAYLAVLKTAVLPIKLLTNNRHQTVSTYVFRAVRGTMEFSLSAR